MKYSDEINRYTEIKNKNEKRKKEIEEILVNLYEDSLTQTIGKEVFNILSNKYNVELDSLLREATECDRMLKKLSIYEKEVDNWIYALLATRGHSMLTYDDIFNLVDKVIVKDVSSSDRLIVVYKVGILKSYVDGWKSDIQKVRPLGLNDKSA